MKKVKEQSGTYDESELMGRTAGRVPIRAKGIGTRISEVSDLVGSRKEAAKAAGVSVASLQRYIAEEVEPTFMAVAALADKTNVRLEWIATGEGEMRPQHARGAPLNRDILIDVIHVIEEQLQSGNLYLEPEKKAELIVLVYEEIRDEEGGIDSSRIAKIIHLAAHRR